jgi:hypothetical protein
MERLVLLYLMRTVFAVLLCVGGGLRPAQADPSFYLGQILFVSSPWCPTGTVPANGAILPIVQNQALFTILGNRFGGDGVNTFALPQLTKRLVSEGNQRTVPILACIVLVGVYPPLQ